VFRSSAAAERGFLSKRCGACCEEACSALVGDEVSDEGDHKTAACNRLNSEKVPVIADKCCLAILRDLKQLASDFR
jgi:hypothetical protein